MASGVDRAAPRGGRATLAVLAIGYGCTGGASAAPLTPPLADAGVSVAAARLKFDVDPGLACAGGSGICIAPSQVVTFAVEAVAGTSVSLSLEGSYEDAALTAQDLTLASSPAPVTLEAASSTAKFSIVARVGGPGSDQRVSLPVTVSQSGTATVNVTPSYAGHRPATELYAADFLLATCAELTAEPPDASAVTWTQAASGTAIPLSVPAGERVAVDVRIGHYAFGCADVDPLVPQATSGVPVQVYDVPMALSLTNLNAVLAFTMDAAATDGWRGVAQAAVARVEGKFFASGDPDGKALIDAMRAALGAPGDQAQFDSLRVSGGWDAKANAWMKSHAPSLAARAAVWLSAAETAEIGPLALAVGSEPVGETTAPVTAVSLGPLTWVRAGIVQPTPFQWTPDANDTVHLSGAIDLSATPLFAHLADSQAAASVTSATDVPSAIAIGVGCAGLASSLVGGGVSYGTCTASCTASLCGSGLAYAWTNALVSPAGGLDVVHTTITASGAASVGDQAEPAYVQGGWLGQVSGPEVPSTDGGPGSFPVGGTLLATEPPPQ